MTQREYELGKIVMDVFKHMHFQNEGELEAVRALLERRNVLIDEAITRVESPEYVP